jgi:hypothetical protein
LPKSESKETTRKSSEVCLPESLPAARPSSPWPVAQLVPFRTKIKKGNSNDGRPLVNSNDGRPLVNSNDCRPLVNSIANENSIDNENYNLI